MSNVLPYPERGGVGMQKSNGSQIYGQNRPNIPKDIRFDPLEVENMISFVALQVARLPSNASLRPLPFSPQHAVAQYLRTSPYHIRWSMYIGTRIFQAMLDGTVLHPYIGWVYDFCGRILNLSIGPNTETQELDTRLKSLHNLAGSAFAALGSLAGYTFHRQSLPLFLQVAARFPQVWTNDYEISVSQTLRCQDSTISQFVFTDTVAALVFAIPPLVCYDTTTLPEDWHPPSYWSGLDRIFGWPAAILILFAKINSLRTARQLHQSPLSESERADIEKGLRGWKPVIDYNPNSSMCVAQLAVQECWRHTLLIYMHMAACGATSADPHVENLVQQVFLLARVVEKDHASEEHLFIPCLIAGVAARKEKHRRLFHKKIPAHRCFSHFLLQVSDFIPVLEHLWNGAASGGRAVTWDDYMNSRSSIIPVNI